MFVEQLGEEGAEAWVEFVEELARQSWSDDPELAASLLALAAHEWSDLGRSDRWLDAFREVAAAGVPTVATVDALRTLAQATGWAEGRMPTAEEHEQAIAYADRALAMYEELEASGAARTGRLLATNALMGGASAAKFLGDHERRVYYTERLASEEFASVRPERARPSDFRAAGRARRAVGDEARAQEWFTRAGTTLREMDPLDPEIFWIRREATQPADGIEFGTPEELEQRVRILRDPSLQGHLPELADQAWLAASASLALGRMDDTLRYLSEAETLYFEAKAAFPEERLQSSRAVEAYAQAAGMLAWRLAERGEYIEAVGVVDRMIGEFPDATNMDEIVAERERLLRLAEEGAAGPGGDGDD